MTRKGVIFAVHIFRAGMWVRRFGGGGMWPAACGGVECECVLFNNDSVMGARIWFPQAREARHAVVMMTVAYMANGAKRAAMGFGADTPTGVWYDTRFAQALAGYEAAYGLWANPETGTRLALDDLKAAEGAFFPLYRRFHAAVKGSPLVADSDLEGMGFPPRPAGGRTGHPVNGMFVSVEVIPVGNLVLEVRFANRDTGRAVRPYFLTGAVVYYVVSDVAVTDYRVLACSRLATRSLLRLSFAPSERGRRVYIAARWQNRRGALGPWSEIVVGVVP
jgi:hypothetical protein